MNIAINNVVKNARYPFGSPSTPWDGKNRTVDENGYPTEDFGMIVFTAQIPDTIVTTYNLWYIGNPCTIQFVATNGKTGQMSYNKGVSSIQLTLNAGQTQFMLSFTNVTSAVANLTITRADNTNPTSTFNPAFLKALSPFSGVIRFMDWGATNDNPTSTWNQRPKVTDATWTKVGVPYEIMIELGNTLHRDIWINVPHMADDEYVTNLATLVKQNLDPNLNVFVEYSNEVWNWEFAQATWNLDAAEAEVKQNPNSPLAYDNTTNIYYWGWRRIALRAKQVSDLFASVWGQAAITNRVRPILATQFSYPFVLQTGLDMLNYTYGDISKYIYATAGAPYFNLGPYNGVTNLTVPQGLQALQNSVNGMESTYEVHLVLSRTHGLKFVGYEGGIDTSGPNDLPVKEQINLDPGLAPIMLNYFNTWFGLGFENFNWYVCDATQQDSQYGAWGMLDDINNLTTVKWKTASAYVPTTPPLNGGNHVPGDIDARRYTDRPANWQQGLPYWHTESAKPFYYIINSDNTASYALSVSFSNCTISPGLGLQVFLEGQYVDTVMVPAAACVPPNGFVFSQQISITFKQGINLMYVIPTSGYAFSMQTFDFKLN